MIFDGRFFKRTVPSKTPKREVRVKIATSLISTNLLKFINARYPVPIRAIGARDTTTVFASANSSSMAVAIIPEPIPKKPCTIHPRSTAKKEINASIYTLNLKSITSPS